MAPRDSRRPVLRQPMAGAARRDGSLVLSRRRSTAVAGASGHGKRAGRGSGCPDGRYGREHMKFALSAVGTGSTIRPEWLSPVARKAEALGYESVWIPEHLAVPIEMQARYP